MSAPIDNTWDSGERELARILYCDEQPPRVPHEPSPCITDAMVFGQLFVHPQLREPQPDETDDGITLDDATATGRRDLIAFLGVMWTLIGVLALAIWLVAR